MALSKLGILIFTWLILADLGQVQALIAAGHLKRARAIVETAYRSDRNDPRILYLLAQVREGFGDLEAALRLAEGALRIDSGQSDYHYEVALVCGEMARKASILRQPGLARRTLQEAQTAISLNPNHFNARSLLVTFYMEAPGIVGGDKQKAHRMASELFQINPVEGVLAELEIAQDEHDQAAMNAAYGKLQSYPQSYEAVMALAHHYGSEPGSDAVAERYARSGIQMDATRSEAYGILAILLVRRERWTELDSLLIESEKNVPDDLTPFYNAGIELLHRGNDLARAESYLRKYASQEPEAARPDLVTARRQLNLAIEKRGKRP